PVACRYAGHPSIQVRTPMGDRSPLDDKPVATSAPAPQTRLRPARTQRLPMAGQGRRHRMADQDPGRDAGQRDMPGPERPKWLILAAGGLIYAGALLGVWIALAGQPDAQNLASGSAAAVLAVGAGYFVSQRGKMVPSVRAADLRTLAAVPWRVVT